MEKYSTLPEESLLNRLRSGDKEAFTEIYNRYWEKLLAIALFHSRDKYTAEDMVHDVMLSLWTRRQQVEITTLEGYLATAVKFAVFKHIATGKRRRELLHTPDQQAFNNDIESRLDAKLLQEYLDHAMEKLPEKARVIFQYSRSQEFTNPQIAEKMNLSPKTVEYHITKALKALKEAVRKIKSVFI